VQRPRTMSIIKTHVRYIFSPFFNPSVMSLRNEIGCFCVEHAYKVPSSNGDSATGTITLCARMWTAFVGPVAGPNEPPGFVKDWVTGCFPKRILPRVFMILFFQLIFLPKECRLYILWLWGSWRNVQMWTGGCSQQFCRTGIDYICSLNIVGSTESVRQHKSWCTF
jgi:hypothetical protein